MTEQQNTRPSASREIAVKPLKWVKDPKNVSFVDAEYVDTFGLYCIAERVLFIGHTETGIPFDTVKEAKAAAQADYERRILSALDTTPGNTDPMLIAKYDDELRKVQGGWRGVPISTFERLPEKPGKRSYEHVRCLIFIKGEWEVGMWNCEHLVWDDDEGDDFRYHPTEPTHWMPLPPAPGQPATEQPSEDELEGVIDDIEEIIGETHDIDVTDRRYAENIVAWLKRHHPAALRSLAQEGE